VESEELMDGIDSTVYQQLEGLVGKLPAAPQAETAEPTIEKSTSNVTSMDVDSVVPSSDKPAPSAPAKEKRPAWAGRSAAEPLPEADVYVRLLVIVGLMDNKHVEEVSLFFTRVEKVLMDGIGVWLC
jgi:hypothetical protein